MTSETRKSRNKLIKIAEKRLSLHKKVVPWQICDKKIYKFSNLSNLSTWQSWQQVQKKEKIGTFLNF